MKTKFFFSIISGQIYEVAEDEIDILDQFQIPLKERPSRDCRTCYGRLHRGFDVIQKVYSSLCPKCSRKYIDFHELAKKKKLND